MPDRRSCGWWVACLRSTFYAPANHFRCTIREIQHGTDRHANGSHQIRERRRTVLRHLRMTFRTRDRDRSRHRRLCFVAGRAFPLPRALSFTHRSRSIEWCAPEVGRQEWSQWKCYPTCPTAAVGGLCQAYKEKRSHQRESEDNDSELLGCAAETRTRDPGPAPSSIVGVEPTARRPPVVIQPPAHPHLSSASQRDAFRRRQADRDDEPTPPRSESSPDQSARTRPQPGRQP